FVEFFFDLVPALAVTFLEQTDELVFFTAYGFQIRIGQFAPLLTQGTFELTPLTFDNIPVHAVSPLPKVTAENDRYVIVCAIAQGLLHQRLSNLRRALSFHGHFENLFG